LSFSKFSFAGAIAGAAILALSACSSGATPSATPTSTAVGVDAAAAALLPDTYKTKGINIGSDIPYAPMELFKEDGTTVTGLDYDLSQLIAAKLGVTISFNKQAWDSIIPSVQSGNHDMIMSGMNDTVERQGQLDFVDYFKGGFAIVTSKGNPEGITKLTDLCGKTAVVQTQTVQGDMLRKLDCGSAGPVKLQEYPSDPDAITALVAGKGVADVMDAPIAAYAALQQPTKLELVVDSANPNGYEPVFTGMGVLKGNTGLSSALQAALNSAIADGSYQAVLDKWNLGTFAVTEATINGTK
jgi:polar amino acid transport system substrate-binding protein